MSAAASMPRRRRRWLRRIGVAGFSLLVIAGVLIAWLLLTVSGRDTLLGRVTNLLPAGSLSWERADGVVYGPLTFYGLHFRHNGIDLRARRVMLDPSLRQLFGRRLRLIELEMDDAALDLPASHAPRTLPSWPDVLPKLAIPFSLDADKVRVRGLRISREGRQRVMLRTVDGGIAVAPGMIAAQHLAVDSDRGRIRVDGRVDAAHNYRTDLDITVVAPSATTNRAPADLHVRATGSLDHGVLAASGDAPGPFALKLTLDEGRSTPRWSLSMQAPSFDPASLLVPYPALSPAVAPIPYDIELQANGTGGRVQLQGHYAQAGREFTIEPSQLVYENGIVEAQPLALKLLDGTLVVRGRADLRPSSPVLDVATEFNALHWSASAKAAPVAASGKLALTGNFDAWTVHGSVDLLREKQHAQVAMAGSGDRTQGRFDHFDARTPAGAMTANGSLQWSPQLAWSVDATLARFDPGYVAPGFEGGISGRAQSTGRIDAKGILSLHAAVDGLSGQLRGRGLAGHASVDRQADSGRIDADLHIGASHLQASGSFAPRFDLLAHFDPLRLDDVLPDAHGQLVGQIALRGDASTPEIDGRLTGNALQWRSYGAAHLSLDGRLLARGSGGALSVDADGVAGIGWLNALKLRIDGSEQEARVEGQFSGPVGALSLNGTADRQAAVWNGRVVALHYTPPRGAAWSLASPTALHYDGKSAWSLQHTCIDSSGASICVDADWPHRANLQAQALPLSLLEPWIARPDLDAQAYGTADLQAQIEPAPHGGWLGSAQLHSAEGGLRLQSQVTHPLFGYTGLVAEASLAGERLQGRLDTALIAGGTLHAQATSGTGADAPLSGTAALDLRDITWLELFSADLAAPKGRVEGQLTLGGSRAHPSVSGRAVLDDFQGELPALGVALTQGHVELDADPGGGARVSGSLRSGDGTLTLGGALHWNDPGAPLTLTLKGQNLRIADTPELTAVASPDLQLGYAAGVLNVRGKVDVPAAQMNLERLDNAVSPSPDVVVLDPADAAHGGGALALDMDLTLALGDDVKLKGFGLDGKLGGQLRVRRSPGNPMNASGALNVSGRYAAYGQQLEIERGRLSYSGGGFDDPNLDILAQHEFDQATVGVQVRGTALHPLTQIVSTPAMEASDALAYLVLGRPLQSANADDGRQINAAAAALSVGSNLVAQKVAARLGLDSAGVTESRALGGSAFTVGKYLSPRVLVSYGVSLVGTGEVLTLKYLLRKGFDIQVESGREDRASINWRIEK